MSFECNPKCRLYVGNLSFSTTEDDVRDMFNAVGLVKDVYLPRVFRSRRHRGFGFVEMSTQDDATKAITAFHGQPDPGQRALIVRFADLRRPIEE